MTWQISVAKQKFSELIRKAEREEPQVITRHGEEVAVVLSVEAYRNLIRQKNFKTFLLEGSGLDNLELERSNEAAPTIKF